MPRRAVDGALTTTSSAPAGPSINTLSVVAAKLCTVSDGAGATSRPRRGRSDAQTLDDLAVDDVAVDDLVDVGAVDVGVPDRVRIHDDAGPFLATVEAARLVDAHLPFARQPQRLDAILRVLLHLRGARVRAALLGRVALVEAEEDVAPVIAHRGHAEVERAL